MPGIPSHDQAVAMGHSSELDARWASHEAQAAAAQSQVYEVVEAAAHASLEALSKESEAVSAARLATIAANQAIDARREAEALAVKTKILVDGLPAAVQKAERRAVDEVVAATIQRMNMVVQQVLSASSFGDAAAMKAASQNAQAQALPFQQGKLRAEQVMYSYALQAKELATAAGQLKEKAMEIARRSNPLQSRGNTAAAQQLQMQAHDLMDKASQLEGQAILFDQNAKRIQGTLGDFDRAAEMAARYGAYQANPLGDTPVLPPPPPPPLTLPPPAMGPGPAPAPAPAR